MTRGGEDAAPGGAGSGGGRSWPGQAAPRWPGQR